MCLIPFIFMKDSNSLEVNWGPLSDTSCSGSPYELNRLLKISIVFCVVVLDIS